MQKDVEFQLETEEKEAMAIQKAAICNAPVLMLLDVSNGAWQIVLVVDASWEGWGAILQQTDESKDRHPCHNESRFWNKSEKRYEAGKRGCCWLTNALKTCRNYIYQVRFLAETEANRLVHQLNIPANDLPGALVTHWIARIRLCNFNMKHVPGRLNGGSDGLSRQPRGVGEPEPAEEYNLEETIEARLRGIQVEQALERMRTGRAYTLCVGLRLPEEYKGRWKERAEFLGNWKLPEGNTSKEMQQCWQDGTKYLVTDGVLYHRRKTNEPPVEVLVSTEQTRKAMEAANELSEHHGREGTLRKVEEWYWRPETYDDVKELAKTRQRCDRECLYGMMNPWKA